MGKHDKNLNLFKFVFKKKSLGFGKKSLGSNADTEIGPWFWFPIPKPGFGCTLPQTMNLNLPKID